ncbi:phosphoenolpyruvate--protein phosphotransferase [Homoserinibacter sp. GY 40078]|uniref:phosphoenolpyruvate--protein phosphotransferase n=1 Tax=Homoserinibacter sp. GY 40078 TaxID=2603275 RepID=UPI0011CB8BE6|nr:phosphoenolpyruvate--protein phosphotransferase [Homoserinibacter sp. GY 40078]TXK19987.1 phosphoenolpyruvate--protein phosphotransferase [Homoserinibacter sp. GY 40078]
MEVQELVGVGIGTGIVVGPVLHASRQAAAAPTDAASTIGAEAELDRARTALAAVSQQLRERAEAADEATRDVLEAQALMTEDPALLDGVEAGLASGVTAEKAVADAFAEFAALLADAGEYFAERAADLHDLSDRAVAVLQGRSTDLVVDPGHPYVLVARDLAPADTAVLDLDRVLAFVTSEGGPTSHTAILARQRGIVALVGAGGVESLPDGTQVIVDAERGRVFVDPDAAELADAEARIAAREAEASAPAGPGALADGTPVKLLANLGKPGEAKGAVEMGAEGVGLFRTEFLFLDSADAPTVEEQTESYREVLEAFPGKRVVVRLLDAGADKPLAFLSPGEEENPALGKRGLRALRASEQVLQDQLTALAAADAATDAELWVMAPMVATVEETRFVTRAIHEAGIPVAGVMVEIPSVALIADRVLAQTDFASIGTNDLTQYTMAADRQLGSVAALQDPWHPAVLRLVSEVGAAGAASGKPVGVCGEAAADPLLAVVLAGLGVTSLSMSPTALSDVRVSLARYSMDDARAIAHAALAASEAADAREAARAAADTTTAGKIPA